jgi:hypothetical protein
VSTTHHFALPSQILFSIIPWNTTMLSVLILKQSKINQWTKQKNHH